MRYISHAYNTLHTITYVRRIANVLTTYVYISNHLGHKVVMFVA